MFGETNNNQEKKTVYKFNTFSEGKDQYFTIDVFEENEDIIKYVVNVFLPTDKDGNTEDKICMHIEKISFLSDDKEEEKSEVFYHKIFTYNELLDFAENIRDLKKYTIHPEEITFEHEILKILIKIIEQIKLEYNVYKTLTFPPFRKEEDNINTYQSQIFHKQFSLEESIEFLSTLQNSDTYEFYEEKFNLNKLNVKKVDFMLSRLVDMHLTEGVIGDYSFDDIKKTLQDMNKKYKG